MDEDSPEYREWKAHVEGELTDMIRDSNVVLSFCPQAGEVNARAATELGLSIMLDKPIMLVVGVGVRVPDKLAQIADAIVEADISTEKGREHLAEQMVAFRGHLEG